MIDWALTAEKFGFTSSKDFVGIKRPSVISKCDGCGKLRTIAIRVKSKVVNEQISWICPSCIGLSRSTEISTQMKEKWADSTYLSERQEFSRKLWLTNGFRSRHSIAVRLGMQNNDLHSILTERYKDPAAREKLREISKQLFQDEAFRLKHRAAMNRLEVRQAIAKEARKRWQTTIYREKMAEIRSKQLQTTSKIQLLLYQILEDLSITYHKEGPETKIGWYLFDCCIPGPNGQKILIECQGDYWHSITNAQVRDRQKFTYITRYFPNCKLVYLWEREFYQVGKIRSKIGSLLGHYEDNIDFDFSEIEVRKLNTNDTTKEFLNLYHYLGPGRGGIRIAAFHKGAMVGVALFSTKLRQNLNFPNGSLECSRFCIHPNYHKKNFASWLLSRCTKLLPSITLYAYADSTVGHEGTIYKAAGWQLDHHVPPDYWYVDQEGYVMHKKTLYNRAINLKLTEKEFADKYGYGKIVGGEKTCFILSSRTKITL